MKLERIIHHCNLPLLVILLKIAEYLRREEKKPYLPNDGQANIYITCQFSSHSSALVNLTMPLLQEEKVKLNHVWESTIPFQFQFFINFC